VTSTYREELRGAAASNDAAFAEYVSDLVFPEHLRAASRFAERNERGLILAPRGHAKTTLFTHRAARLIGVKRGNWRLGILTAVDDDAEGRSREIRDLVEHPRFAEVFPWARAGVEGRRWSDGAWTVRGVNLGKDHTCTAMSLGSVRAGPRLDALLADDPVGQQENLTPAGRLKALETYRMVVDPMIVPGGTRTFLGTRWHEDDIYASLMRKGWPYIVRKAIGDDGTALWPDYWSLALLEAQRTELGSAVFDLQYQNDPTGMGGNIIRRDWFRYVNQVPAGARSLGIDLAASSKERSDYTAAVEWVTDGDGNLYLVGAWRERLDEGHRAWVTGVDDAGAPVTSGPADAGPRLLWPTESLPAGFTGLTDRYTAARPLVAVNIEATQYQSTFVRELLARTGLPARAVYPDKDKVTRARTLAARYEGGKVFHLRDAPGREAFEAEAVAFPNGRNDDLVDAAVYGADLNGANEFSFGSVRRF
jgi:predicted phage terminase large subunit-like protein